MDAKIRKTWFKVTLYYLFIVLGLSSIPGTAIEGFLRSTYLDNLVYIAIYTVLGFLLENLDKLAHIVIYTVLGFLLGKTPSRVIAILLLGAVLGGFDEFYQHWIPGRHPDVFDWITDMIGISFGLWLARKIFVYEKKISSTTSR